MSLQIGIHNRRKFLERSALGAGSLLFAPLLLDSCTDHNIPPINPPPLGDDDDIDWNDDAKTAVGAGLGLIPEVGGILSALVTVFWPNSNDVWQQVRLIDQEISAEVYSLVKDSLGSLTPTPTGLISYIQTYQDELKNGQPGDIKQAWVNAKDAFAGAQGYFQDPSNQVQLLPLFAQFANLYLALLRDGVAFGQSWGRTNDEHNNIDVPALKNAITAFATYTVDTYNNIGRVKVANNAGSSRLLVEPFRSVNAYDRQMTMLVLDYMDTWQYYDVTQYPNGAKNPDGTKISLFNREIYSDPYGNVAIIPGTTPPPGPAIVLPSPATQFPTQITVWAGDRIDAVQLTYPAGGGPNGVTTTPRMGDSQGGSNQPPHGGILDISPDTLPIIRAQVTTEIVSGSTDGDQIINTIQFILSNGNGNTLSPQYGGDQGNLKSGIIGYDNYALSSIYIHGSNVHHPDTSADCIVFGFMLWPPR